MFEHLRPAPPDPILGLNEAFRNDPNPNKINLSVGVYKDSAGKTPILLSVKDAERQLWETEPDKSYLPIDGSAAFGEAVRNLMLGPALAARPAATSQTPGGTAALRVAAEFLAREAGVGRIWCSNPTWANHPAVFQAGGLEVATYPYLNEDKTGLDFAAMCEVLDQIPAGEAICLHACCHNPTGVDPSAEQWREIARILQARQVLPLVDCAYQGFGRGLEADVEGLRILAEQHQELLIASSYSKNFGLYGERTGALTLLAGSREAAAAAQSQIKRTIRANYSNPPRHGGAIVTTILNSPQLTGLWHQELTEMGQRIRATRQLLVDALAAAGSPQDFSFISQQLGMFSNSRLTPLQVDRLRQEESIYIVGSGRINVAGITAGNVRQLAEAIVKVIADSPA